MSKFLALSFCILFFITGVGVGYIFTPEYQRVDSMNMGLGEADRFFDLRYINAMTAHHKGAIALADQLKNNTQRQELKGLANAILEDEPNAIRELEEWKKQWYNDANSVVAALVPNLGTYDERFDLRFLNALISHHEDGVKMADETLRKSSRNEILTNADAVKTFLNGGIKMLKEWRLNWYSI